MVPRARRRQGCPQAVAADLDSTLLGEVISYYRDALDGREVDAEVDFFAAGGNSLAALALVTDLTERFGVQISIRQLLDGLSPQDVAALVDATPPPVPEHSEFVTESATPQLSFAQERLWLLEQLHPGRATYNTGIRHRVHGQLDVSALAEAYSTVVARHDVLRTRIEFDRGLPLAVIDQPTPVEIEVHDLRGAEQPDTELSALVDLEATRPFSLERDLMLRVTVYRVSEQEWVVQVAAHHIALDAWSIACLCEEVTESYAAIIESRSARLPHLPMTYSGIAAQERAAHLHGRLEEGLAMWDAELAEPRPLGLKRSSKRGSDPDKFVLAARSLTSDDLDGAARTKAALRLTDFLFGLATSAAVLAEAASEHDVIVGTILADRQDPNKRNLIGLCVNTLPMRLAVPEDVSMVALAAEARRAAGVMLEHGHVPFDLIVDRVGAARDRSVPLIDATFAVESDDAARGLALAGSSVELEEASLLGAKFDLDFVLVDDAEPRLEVIGRETMFDPHDVDLFADRWLELFRFATSTPEAPLPLRWATP